MSVIYDKIRVALERYLSLTSTLPDVAWPNVDYTPTTGTPFIKVQFQPTSRRPSVKGPTPRHRYQGLLTLLCYQPEGQGSGASDDLANLLVDRFNSTVDIIYDGVAVRVEYSEVQSSYINSPWYVTPVTIAWFSYD